jgi:hypothetical protein
MKLEGWRPKISTGFPAAQLSGLQASRPPSIFISSYSLIIFDKNLVFAQPAAWEKIFGGMY